jgi:hypothetical protein
MRNPSKGRLEFFVLTIFSCFVYSILINRLIPYGGTEDPSNWGEFLPHFAGE